MQVKPVKTGKAPTRHPLPTAAEVAANPTLSTRRHPARRAESASPWARAWSARSFPERRVASGRRRPRLRRPSTQSASFPTPTPRPRPKRRGRASSHSSPRCSRRRSTRTGAAVSDASPSILRSFADASEVFFLGDGDPCRPQREVPGRWLFDFATEDGSILVEFLSTKDHDKLKDVHPGAGAMSSVQFYDLPHRAARFREELETRTNGAPVTIALFFDPMAKGASWKEKGGRYIRPDSAFKGMTLEEYDALGWEKREELKRQDSRRLLLEQIRFFLDWAKKEGKLPAP